MSKPTPYPCMTKGCTNTVMRRPDEYWKTLCIPCLSKKSKEETAALKDQVMLLTENKADLEDRLSNALNELDNLHEATKVQADEAVRAFIVIADAIITVHNTIATGGQIEEVVDALTSLKEHIHSLAPSS